MKEIKEGDKEKKNGEGDKRWRKRMEKDEEWIK